LLCSHNNIIQFTSYQVTIYPKLQVGCPMLSFMHDFVSLSKINQQTPLPPTFIIQLLAILFIHYQFSFKNSSIINFCPLPNGKIFIHINKYSFPCDKRFHEFCPHQLLMWNFNIYIIYLFVKLTYSCSLIHNVELLSPN